MAAIWKKPWLKVIEEREGPKKKKRVRTREREILNVKSNERVRKEG